jgi:hypothetical protein
MPPLEWLAPFGIQTTIVELGLFRTELLSQDYTSYAERTPDRHCLEELGMECKEVVRPCLPGRWSNTQPG